MNCYIHVLPGRMRIRTDALKKNELGAYSLRKSLLSLPGVRSVATNMTTGSILIRFDNLQIPPQTIMGKVAQHQLMPILDCTIPGEENTKALRVWVQSSSISEMNIWPFVLKKAAQFILSSLDFQPRVLNVAAGIVLPVIVDAIVA